MAIPPGVSERDFARATDRLASVVGSEWVFTSDEDVALYRDAYSPLFSEPGEKVASAAVAPESAEQVQEIVRIANEYRIPLYPISTGKNLGYGGSAPVLSGSVVLDLKRMNRILEVDERNAFALVEPGVSYFDLYRHIQEQGLRLWIDCPDPGWGSVIGNALDHGVGYTMNPYRDHFDAHCGMEVVTVAQEESGTLKVAAALEELAKRGITRLLVEGGGQLAASLMRANLVDRLYWFRAAKVIGAEGRPGLGGLLLGSLKEAPRFRLDFVRHVGEDLLERYSRDD